jgi:hypothetical protein
MILDELATLCVNEYVTKPRRVNTQASIFSLLVACCTTLTMEDVNICSIEERLVTSVLVHKKTAQVKR